MTRDYLIDPKEGDEFMFDGQRHDVPYVWPSGKITVRRFPDEADPKRFNWRSLEAAQFAIQFKNSEVIRLA